MAIGRRLYRLALITFECQSCGQLPRPVSTTVQVSCTVIGTGAAEGPTDVPVASPTDGARDEISCGKGVDRVKADRLDRIVQRARHGLAPSGAAYCVPTSGIDRGRRGRFLTLERRAGPGPGEITAHHPSTGVITATKERPV